MEPLQEQELQRRGSGGSSGSGSPSPIATTPPLSHPGRKEELLSQSSSSPGSGTQVSSTSGVSLGEAIRQTANQGMKSWYQLPVEEDASCFVTGAEQTELSTVEEGVLTLAAGPRQGPAEHVAYTPLLEIQDSGLSPCLPLPISNTIQGKGFFEETLFQQSELDFAPLRGSLDVSEVSRQHTRPLQITSDAEQLVATEASTDLVSGCFTLSQHPFALSTLQAGDASSIYFLSQHPISPLSPRIEEEGKGHGNQTGNSDVHCNPDGNKHSVVTDNVMVINGQVELQKHGISSTDDTHKVSATDDVLFLDSSIPAPLLLELLEKEIGLSNNAGISSGSGNSSSKTSARGPDEYKTQQEVEVADLQELGLGQESWQSLSEIKPILEFEPSFRDYTEANNPTKSSKMLMTTVREYVDLSDSPPSDLSGITVCPLIRPLNNANKDELLKQLCSEILHKHQEKEASDSTRNCTSQSIHIQPATENAKSTETYSNKKNTTEIRTGDIRAELTVSSGCSIERGHKDTYISPSVNPPMDDSSFCEQLVDPICQSTPGIFMNKSSKPELPGKLTTIKSSLQSLTEELSSRSSKSTLTTSFHRVQSDQSGHEANFESRDSLRESSPTGRIGSLPTLSYIEKVGAWNMNRPSEKILSDTLLLRGLTGVSPKKKAYSAVASSLNRILSKQTNYSSPKRTLAASFASVHSLSGLNSEDKNPTCTLSLTRSLSDNIINIRNKDNLQAEEPQTKIQKESVQALKEENFNRGCKTGMPDGEKNKADLKDFREKHITASHDTSGPMNNCDFKGKGLEENLSNFNEKVPKLFKENVHDKQEKFSILKEPPDATSASSKITKHQFSDVSMDTNFNMLCSSPAKSHLEQTVTESTGVVSDHSLTSLEVDNYAPYWSPAIKTPDKEEINIEDRIPTYLQNLGIDQSPSTILKPFVPQGTIKELEFSPSELQTVKGSTDTPTKSVSQFEGDSQKDIDNSQSSFYSGVSTLSMSIPMGSDVGNDTPLPTELLSPSILRSFQERPISQCNITYCHAKQVELPSQLPIEGTAEIANAEESYNKKEVLPELPVSHSYDENPQVISKHVQLLIDKFESRSPTLNRDNPTSSSLVKTAVGMEGSRALSSNFGTSFKQQNKDVENDSFVGSRTLKEIRKLLEEAEDITHESSNHVSLCSVKEYDDFSSSLNCFRDSTSPRDSTGSLTPLLERKLSWGSSSSVSKDIFQIKSLSSLMDGLKWETTDGISQPTTGKDILQEPIGKTTISAVQETAEQSKIAKQLRRSEPEGCSGAIVDTNIPASAHREEGGITEESSVEKGFDLQSSLSTEISSGVSSSLERLEHALAQMSITGNVKGDRVRESDDSSSADSLAARVASLLKGEEPLTHASRMIQNAEEEEKKARVWVKLKLVSQPPDCGVDLNEEDRKKIEEIKAELLKSAEKAGSVKNLWSIGLKTQDFNQKQYNEQFRTSNISQSSDQGLVFGSKPDWLQNKNASIDVIHIKPGHTVDSSLSCYSKYKTSATKESSVLHQLQQVAVSHADSINTESHRDSSNDTVTNLKRMAGTDKTQIELEPFSPQHLSDDISKPVSSITSSSRRRSPSLSVTPVHTNTAEDRPHLHNIVPLVDQTTALKDHTPLIKQMGIPRACDSFSPKSCLLTGNRNEQLQKTEVSKDESFQGSDILSVQGPEFDMVKQSQNSSTQIGGFKTAWTLRQGSPQKISTQEVKTQFEASSVTSVSAVTGYNSVVQSSSPTPIKTTDSISASSPARKAISCVYLTLSPKPNSPKMVNFDSHEEPDESYTNVEARSIRNCETDRQEKFSLFSLRPLAVPESTNSESASKTQGSSYFPVPMSSPDSYFVHYPTVNRFDPAKNHSPMPLHGSLGMSLSRKMDTMPCDASRQIQRHDNSKTVVPMQREKESSDAMTQITTESPEKTTLSAEIYICPTDEESITNRPHSRDIFGTPGVSSLLPNQISLSSQPVNQSQLLSYRPKESPEMCFIPYPEEKHKITSVRSDTTIESSHSDQSQLLSYRPKESPEMCFIPYREEEHKITPVRSDTTIESSHPGSNDAIAPEFPVEVLGSRDSNVSDIVTIKHTEGIYSRRSGPKRAWEEIAMTPQDAVTDSRRHLKSIETVQPVSRMGQKSTSQATHNLERQNFGIHGAYKFTPGTLSPRNFRHGSATKEDHLQFLHYREKVQQEEDRFSPLRAEMDYGRDENIIDDITVQSEMLKESSKLSAREQIQGYPPTKSQVIDARSRRGQSERSLKQSTLLCGSLDELWARFTERQRKHHFHHNSSGELSLLQRLDRLARLLQNPVGHSLRAVEVKLSSALPKSQKQEVLESRHTVGKESSLSGLSFHQYAPDTAVHPDVWHSEDTPEFGLSRDSRPYQIREISTDRIRRILQEKRHLDTPSESSSTTGPAKQYPSTITDTTESEVTTQTDSEMVTQTETSSSISTIDTARLIRAFGPQKVHVPSKLSQLYSTIDQQKGRAEHKGKGIKKASEKEHLKIPFPEQQRSKKDTQVADSVVSSDTMSTDSSAWGPSPALSNKRNTRLLSKGIQAGDLEIVSSATKRNTRDVGMTFPSPPSKKEMAPRDSPGTEYVQRFFNQPDWQRVQLAGNEAEEKKWPNGILMGRTTRKNKLNLARGVSWFVPAEVLKSSSKKENNYKPMSWPGPTWFEPLTHAKPWREPLREKNMQEEPIYSQISTEAHPAISLEEVNSKTVDPFERITLQESLRMCRPDFISRSRQRLKRLELLTEERQLQSVFEHERGQLFNCPEETRRGWKDINYVLSERELQRKAVPKKEMVQRSKRMYEQLPEIKKRKEEAKRKEEYKSYRLKAQLYKRKVMNNILGRKTPWN